MYSCEHTKKSYQAQPISEPSRSKPAAVDDVQVRFGEDGQGRVVIFNDKGEDEDQYQH